MPADHGPTARHRRLAAELRRLRDAASLSPDEAAAAIGFSRSKLVKIETATVMPREHDVGLILGAYGGSDQALRLALLDLAKRIRERGWWAPFGDILQGSYAELEDAANRIRSWQPQLVPGLLQTRDYARVLIARGHTSDVRDIDRRLQVRMHRQTILAREAGPVLEVVLAEQALRHPIGGAGVMRAQLTALLDAVQRPSVSIRVVPTRVGWHPAIGQGPLVIFGFDSAADLDTAYVETIAGGHYIEEAGQVRHCTVMLESIRDVALSEAESEGLIATIVKE